MVRSVVSAKSSWIFPASIIALLVVLGLAILGPFRFGYFSICTICGRWRTTIERQALPLLGGWTYWTTHREQPTTISTLLEEFRVLPDHPHQWVFGWGAGNGVQCALGNGRYIDQTCRHPKVLSFMRDLCRYRNPEEVRIWTARFFGPKSFEYRSSLWTIPDEGCRDEQEFDAALQKAEEWASRVP